MLERIKVEVIVEKIFPFRPLVSEEPSRKLELAWDKVPHDYLYFLICGSSAKSQRQCG